MPMSAFENVETSVLIDLLAKNTLHLTQLFLTNDVGTEYQYYKQLINDLQNEIASRRDNGREPFKNLRGSSIDEPSAF